MRRPPQTQWKYLLNTNPTHLEVHDLDNETAECQIAKIIAAGHAVYLIGVNNEAQLAQWLRQNPSWDGCGYCLPQYNWK
jgi:hypothetical protein